MHVAGLLKRTGILGLGQATAWVGVGLAIGLFVGRSGPLTEYRQSAGRLAAPVAAVLLVSLAAMVLGNGHRADAQEQGRWVQTAAETNPGNEDPPPGWEVNLSTTSITAVHTFGPDDDSGAQATFNASRGGTARWPDRSTTLGCPVRRSRR
jgi:hypothetical protein